MAACRSSCPARSVYVGWMYLTILKSIVVCLALANAGYFLWAHGVAASKEVPNAVAPPTTTTTTLKLVGEAPSVSHQAVGSLSGAGIGAAVNDASNPSLLTNVKR